MTSRALESLSRRGSRLWGLGGGGLLPEMRFGLGGPRSLVPLDAGTVGILSKAVLADHAGQGYLTCHYRTGASEHFRYRCGQGIKAIDVGSTLQHDQRRPAAGVEDQDRRLASTSVALD